MRVVILTDDHPPMVGGVAVFTERVCRALVRGGHEVTVIARWRRTLGRVEGTRLVGAWGPRFSRLGGSWLAIRGQRALLRADAVLATTWPVATGLPALGVPFSVVAHGSDVTRPPRDPRAFGRVWGAAQHRLAMSAFLARFVDGRVLPAPVELPATPGPGGDRWVYVARATPLKGGDRFVRWVAHAGVGGDVIGDGPELARWRALAADLGADVHFHGRLSPERTLARVGRSALAALLPRVDADGTGAEGFGLTLVEAAALGVPVVGCAVGGVPEAVGPGLVIPDPDNVPASVLAIRAFSEGRPGEAARRWVADRHGADRCVAALFSPRTP